MKEDKEDNYKRKKIVVHFGKDMFMIEYPVGFQQSPKQESHDPFATFRTFKQCYSKKMSITFNPKPKPIHNMQIK